MNFTGEDMQTQLINRNLIIKLDVDMDHHGVNLLKDKINQAYKHSEAKNIIFDFSKVNFMDSSGIGMIIGRYKFLKNFNACLAVSNIKPELEAIILVSGLKKIIKIYPSVDDAVKDLI
jgi:stage II sporulation protein AA (anti-sigma F factor antagonist)